MLETWGGQIWNQIKIENFKDLQIKQENKKCTTSLFMQKKRKKKISTDNENNAIFFQEK